MCVCVYRALSSLQSTSLLNLTISKRVRKVFIDPIIGKKSKKYAQDHVADKQDTLERTLDPLVQSGGW